MDSGMCGNNGRGMGPRMREDNGWGMGPRIREDNGWGMGMGPRMREDNGWGMGVEYGHGYSAVMPPSMTISLPVM